MTSRARSKLTDRAPPLIVVVGMKAEARIVGHPGVLVIVGGGRAGQFSEKLDLALQRGAAGVMSFGLCGGLDPSLKVGDRLIGSSVTGAEGRWAADADWVKRLTSSLPGSIRAAIAGSGGMLALPTDKAALRQQTGAAAVDMESHVVASAAQRRGVPFAVLRAVSDPADRALPLAAQAGLRADGEPDVGAVLRALIRHPGELPALIRTAREAGAAFAALRDARHLLGPGLGCPNFVEHPVDVS